MAKNQDLRDIHGFDRNNAVAISAGNGVSIYRTGDGGKSWRIAYEDTHRVVFFDGLDFNASGFGVAYGDPMDGKMALLMSQDFGATWKAVEDSLRPELDSNEAGYAASGTGIIVTDSTVIIATGGGTQESHVCLRPCLEPLRRTPHSYRKWCRQWYILHLLSKW